MIVLLFSVMAGLAALARGVLFTTAVCLALVVSVSVLVGSLRVARAVGAPAWLPGAVAILAFVLVVGGPAYLLAIRGESAAGSATPAEQGSGVDSTGDASTGDPHDGASEQAGDEGATPGGAAPDDAGTSGEHDEHTDTGDQADRTDSGEQGGRTDSGDRSPGSDGSRESTSDSADARPTDPSVDDGPPGGRDGARDGESPGTPGG